MPPLSLSEKNKHIVVLAKMIIALNIMLKDVHSEKMVVYIVLIVDAQYKMKDCRSLKKTIKKYIRKK